MVLFAYLLIQPRLGTFVMVLLPLLPPVLFVTKDTETEGIGRMFRSGALMRCASFFFGCGRPFPRVYRGRSTVPPCPVPRADRLSSRFGWFYFASPWCVYVCVLCCACCAVRAVLCCACRAYPVVTVRSLSPHAPTLCPRGVSRSSAFSPLPAYPGSFYRGTVRRGGCDGTGRWSCL